MVCRMPRRFVIATMVMAGVMVTWQSLLFFIWTNQYYGLSPYQVADDHQHQFQHVRKEQEDWPDVAESQLETIPLQATHTVHYLWCGKKEFVFSDYLGVLSILRTVRPLKLVFYYTHLPPNNYNTYHTWFRDLKNTTHNLELRSVQGVCGTRQLLQTMLDAVFRGGGMYVGESLILTHIPADLLNNRIPVWFAFAEIPSDLTRGIVWVSRELTETAKNLLTQSILSSKPSCLSAESYNNSTKLTVPCVKVDSHLAPLNISEAPTKFAQMARWLFYGSRRTLRVVNGTGETIPRLSHYVWLSTDDKGLYAKNFTFSQFVSVLSALYVGGFHQVWVHGDLEPKGSWWDQLKKENVTFVKLEKPATVFQQTMMEPAHISDVLRFAILEKYGGAYQDFDVVWSNRVPDWLLTYPAVICPDWVKTNFPSTFNMGVMMAHRRSAYLQHLLRSYRDYRDSDWFFNAIQMPFKIKELHPHTAFVYTHLQVLCCLGQCHPPWDENYVRVYNDPRPLLPFDWRETCAIHITWPKPAPVLVSPLTLRNGKDVIADVGRHVLKQSGRQDLIG